MTRLVQLTRRTDSQQGYESDIERGMDFSAVFAETIGQIRTSIEIPEWDTPPADLRESAWRALHEVADPEFPISLPGRSSWSTMWRRNKARSG